MSDVSTRFLAGELVTIRMASNNVLPWSIQFDAWYIRGPCGEGDVWEFDTLDGTRLALNGNSPEFVGFWRTPNVTLGEHHEEA